MYTIQFFDEKRVDIVCRVLPHKDVQVAIPGNDVQRVKIALMAVEILMRPNLALGQEAQILFAPSKAANAGGVAVSGLEMSQNSMRLPWGREEVDKRLQEIMKNIHQTCMETAKRFDCEGNYVNGANIGGFLKVADAMIDQGLV